MASTFLVGEDHRLEYVDDLCDIRHLHTVGMTMEDIERQGSDESVTQGVLLIEVSGDCPRLFVPPCSPLIDEQSYRILRVFLIHDSLVLLDDFLNLQTLTQSPVVLVGIEIDGRAFRAIPARACVVMQTDSLHAVADILHQHFRPVIVIVAGT